MLTDSNDSSPLLSVLSGLQCPYQVDDQVLCSFYEREAFCPFSHRCERTPCSDIPQYICVDHLVGKCIADNISQVQIENDWLARCSSGYHPTWTQLIDLEQLDQKVQKAHQDQAQAANKDLKCAICLLEPIPSPYGLLEHCSHLFCAECIVVWKETARQKRCPMCRVYSRKVLLWPNTDPILNEQIKLELFRMHARCIVLFNRDNRDLEVTQAQQQRRLTRVLERLTQDQERLAQEQERLNQQQELLNLQQERLDQEREDLAQEVERFVRGR